MASAVAMMIGGAVVNAWPSQEVIFILKTGKLKMLKKKEKDMIEQSNN